MLYVNRLEEGRILRQLPSPHVPSGRARHRKVTEGVYRLLAKCLYREAYR